MAGLLGIRWMVGGYLWRAEDVGTWRWLDEGKQKAEGDEVLVTWFGEEMIGAVVIRGVRDADVISAGKGGKKSQRSNSGGKDGGSNGKVKGVIRAWTVRQRYRRKGLGGDLLEEAVKLCREKGWSGPVFAEDHANSGRVLPALFNGGMEKREVRARTALEKYVEGFNAVGGGKSRKGRR